MSYQSSPYNSNNINEDYDYEDDFYEDQNNINDDNHEQSEDTDEASETDFISRPVNDDEPVEIKEQMYQDKLSNLKKQLEELKTGSHPEYLKRVKKLEYQYKERLRLNEVYKDYLIEFVERDYILEKKAAIKEYEEKKADLKENLLSDFEDKRKMIESERLSMELTGDSMEQVKPNITRKLRRRPNEPLPVVEKRRKPTNQLILLLEEKDIENDMKLISRGKNLTPIRPQNISNNGISNNTPAIPNNDNFPLVETKIEDGKLLYERRWFHRGQTVYVERDISSRFPATISAIGNEVIWVKNLNDGNKVRIYTAQLKEKKVSIKRRAN